MDPYKATSLAHGAGLLIGALNAAAYLWNEHTTEGLLFSVLALWCGLVLLVIYSRRNDHRAGTARLIVYLGDVTILLASPGLLILIGEIGVNVAEVLARYYVFAIVVAAGLIWVRHKRLKHLAEASGA